MFSLQDGFSSDRSSARGISQYTPVATEHPRQESTEYLDISSFPVEVQKAFANFNVDHDSCIRHQDLLLAGQLLKQHRLQTQYLNKVNLVGVFVALMLAAFGGSYAAADIHKDTTIDAANTTMMSRSSGKVIATASTVFGISNERYKAPSYTDESAPLSSGPIMIDPWRNPIQVEQASYFVPVRSFAKFPLLSSAALDGIQSLQVLSNGTEYNFKIMGFDVYGIHTQNERVLCFHTASRQVVIITVTGMVFVVSEGNWSVVAAQLRLASLSAPSHEMLSSERRLNILQDIGNGIKNFCIAIVDVTVDLFNAIIGGFKAAGNWVVDEWNKITR